MAIVTPYIGLSRAATDASVREARAEGEAALRFAKIGVLSQRERHTFNLSQARAFAKQHARPLFYWRYELTGVAAGWLTEEEATPVSS